MYLDEPRARIALRRWCNFPRQKACDEVVRSARRHRGAGECICTFRGIRRDWTGRRPGLRRIPMVADARAAQAVARTDARAPALGRRSHRRRGDIARAHSARRQSRLDRSGRARVVSLRQGAFLKFAAPPLGRGSAYQRANPCPRISSMPHRCAILPSSEERPPTSRAGIAAVAPRGRGEGWREQRSALGREEHRQHVECVADQRRTGQAGEGKRLSALALSCRSSPGARIEPGEVDPVVSVRAAGRVGPVAERRKAANR